MGREFELQRITDSFEASATSGKIVLVRGESGIGKTTLLKHWTRALLRADESTLLLYVGCHLQDHTPLRALNLIAQQLVTLLPELPRDVWEDLTASEGAEIVYGFPQMQQLVGMELRKKDHRLELPSWLRGARQVCMAPALLAARAE